MRKWISKKVTGHCTEGVPCDWCGQLIFTDTQITSIVYGSNKVKHYHPTCANKEIISSACCKCKKGYEYHEYFVYENDLYCPNCIEMEKLDSL